MSWWITKTCSGICTGDLTIALTSQKQSHALMDYPTSLFWELSQIQSHLAIFSRDLSSAEEWYMERASSSGLVGEQEFKKWPDAIALEVKTDRAFVVSVEEQHMTTCRFILKSINFQSLFCRDYLTIFSGALFESVFVTCAASWTDLTNKYRGNSV